MQIEIHGQQIDVTPALRDYVETRFARIGRHFDRHCQIRVSLGLDKPHHKADATMTLAGRSLHADASAQDMYAAIDLLADKLDRLVVKQKERQLEQRRGEVAVQDDAIG